MSKVILSEAAILKATRIADGDGWKDTAKAGDVVFVHNVPLPPPHSPGQMQRLGEQGWTVGVDEWTFVPATPQEVRDAVMALVARK